MAVHTSLHDLLNLTIVFIDVRKILEDDPQGSASTIAERTAALEM